MGWKGWYGTGEESSVRPGARMGRGRCHRPTDPGDGYGRGWSKVSTHTEPPEPPRWGIL